MVESLRIRMTHVHRSLFLITSVPKDPPLNDLIYYCDLLRFQLRYSRLLTLRA